MNREIPSWLKALMRTVLGHLELCQGILPSAVSDVDLFYGSLRDSHGLEDPYSVYFDLRRKFAASLEVPEGMARRSASGRASPIVAPLDELPADELVYCQAGLCTSGVETIGMSVESQ